MKVRGKNDEFGLTEEQRMLLLENAIEAAFTTEEVKNELREQLGMADQ